MIQELKNSGIANRKRRQVPIEPVLDENGYLVTSNSSTENLSPAQSCPDNMHSTCVTNCDAVTCHDYLRLNKTGNVCISNYMCEMQCKCKNDLYFNSGECVTREECQVYGEMLASDHHEVKQPCSNDEKICNGGMVWFECHNNCPIRTCADAAIDVWPHCYKK